MAHTDFVRVAPAGDSALLLEFEPRIDPAINARAIALGRTVRARLGTSVRDAVVGYCTLTLYFDPRLVDAAWLEAEVRALVSELEDVAAGSGAMVEVPVCYGGELGPDLEDVARFAGCSDREVITLHSVRAYRVYMVGFVPGFAYLAEVDPRIATPRRGSPRTAVPPGSVAIAGGQTGIYPSTTPGGWNIIGRTPVKPFDPSRADPFLFHAGDTVRFVPITRQQFDAF